jgi:hypothetical protein
MFLATFAGALILERVLGHGQNDIFPYAVDDNLIPVGPSAMRRTSTRPPARLPGRTRPSSSSALTDRSAATSCFDCSTMDGFRWRSRSRPPRSR